MLACGRLTTRPEARSLGLPEEAARYCEQALAIVEEAGAVDLAHVIRENLDSARQELARERDRPAAAPDVLPDPKDQAPPKQAKRHGWWPFRG